jgi:hypothetical protein
VPRNATALNEKVHRNHAMFQDHVSGKSIIKIARIYGLTYERTRFIIKEHNMRQYFVADLADELILFEGTSEECETILDHYSGNLSIVGYRDLTPSMVESLKQLRSKTKEQL